MSLMAWTLAAALTTMLAGGRAEGADRRLADAAKNRDTASVKALLKQGIDANAPQPDGATALHWAAHWGELDIADLLLRAGANPNAANDLGVTPLVLACTDGTAAVVDALLAAGADPNLALPTGETPLMIAARTGKPALIDALLKRRADLNASERSRGQTALMWAAAEGHADAVKRLLEAGADMNARSKSGYTPLLFAARRGDAATTRHLLDGGARIDDVSSDGISPLLMALVRGFLPLAEFLIQQGADVNNDKAGYTALHWAAGAWDTELTVDDTGIKADQSEWNAIGGLHEPVKLDFVTKLLRYGAKVNARMTANPGTVGGGGDGPKGRRGSSLAGATPFYLAAESADAELMRALIAAGADPTIGTRSGRTPLMAAVGIGRIQGTSRATDEQALQAARLALSLGSDVNAADQSGDTALHAAAYWGSNTLVQFLADAGAHIDPVNKAGNTPFMIADGQGPRVAGVNPHNPETATLLGTLGADTAKRCEWPCLRYTGR